VWRLKVDSETIAWRGNILVIEIFKCSFVIIILNSAAPPEKDMNN
jgi:hypothetical protein